MVEQLTRQSALSRALKPGRFGADRDGGPGISVTERHPLSITQFSVWDDKADAVLKAVAKEAGVTPDRTPMSAVDGDGIRSVWIAPDRWFLVQEEETGLAEKLSARLKSDQAAVVDQSHGRTVLRLAGADVRALLSKGSGLDFHADHFKPGEVKSTHLGHYNVMLDCVAEDVFDLYLMRTFAVSAWEWLEEAAGEFGFEVKAA